MLKNAENTALQNLPILYTFVLRAEICTTFGVKVFFLWRVAARAVVFSPNNFSGFRKFFVLQDVYAELLSLKYLCKLLCKSLRVVGS